MCQRDETVFLQAVAIEGENLGDHCCRWDRNRVDVGRRQDNALLQLEFLRVCTEAPRFVAPGSQIVLKSHAKLVTHALMLATKSSTAACFVVQHPQHLALASAQPP